MVTTPVNYAMDIIKIWKDSMNESLPYSERLKVLDSVKGQLIRHDLIMRWKIFHNLSVIQPKDLFQLSPFQQLNVIYLGSFISFLQFISDLDFSVTELFPFGIHCQVMLWHWNH